MAQSHHFVLNSCVEQQELHTVMGKARGQQEKQVPSRGGSSFAGPPRDPLCHGSHLRAASKWEFWLLAEICLSHSWQGMLANGWKQHASSRPCLNPLSPWKGECLPGSFASRGAAEQGPRCHRSRSSHGKVKPTVRGETASCRVQEVCGRGAAERRDGHGGEREGKKQRKKAKTQDSSTVAGGHGLPGQPSRASSTRQGSGQRARPGLRGSGSIVGSFWGAEIRVASERGSGCELELGFF